MAQARNYVTQYREVEVKTADQFELVLLLYKGAMNQLNFAKRYLVQDNIEGRVRSINKASAMIGELQAALDFRRGGEIAASLSQLYTYMLNQLSIANVHQEKTPIDEVIRLLTTLQSAWEQAGIVYRTNPVIAQTARQETQAAATSR